MVQYKSSVPSQEGYTHYRSRKPVQGNLGVSRDIPARHRPRVTFTRNRLGQWMPATPEDLEVCMDLGVKLQPNLAPGDVIKDVEGKVFVIFQPNPTPRKA